LIRILVGFLIASSLGLFAQNRTGRISGVVSDVSKAVIPGASITVTNQDTGATWNATTDSNGSYVIVNLPVGTYSVEVETQGFSKAEKTGYDLVADGRITADFPMQVGSLNESVAVTEVLGEKVNTVSGEVGRTIDSEQVKDLALNGGNYLQLITLIPGAAVLDEDQMACCGAGRCIRTPNRRCWTAF
jgi:citrate lyase alpha subunit